MSIIDDKHSQEWLAVREYCTQRLAEMRQENDGDLDPVATAKIRGAIEFAQEVIALDQVPVASIVNPVRYT